MRWGSSRISLSRRNRRLCHLALAVDRGKAIGKHAAEPMPADSQK
jgi:hypothetical protein